MKNSLAHRSACVCVLVASLSALSACGGSGGGSNSPVPPQMYTIGGSVTGLASGASIVLLDNNGDALTVSANGTFVFATALSSGSTYVITVRTQPTGQTCSVSAGSGTVGSANVSNVVVSCTTNTYTIGGTIQGLSSSGLVLANGSDTLKVSANATGFTMPTAVTDSTAYDVTVESNPPALSCTVTNGTGTVASADVTNISVSCQPGAESVLYSFKGGTTDGAYSYSTLIQANDGNLYGTTSFGGANGAGTVFKITPGGAESVLYSFKGGTTDGGGPLGSLIQASDGDLYGVTATGGANGYGSVFKVTLSGTESILYSFKGGTTDGDPRYGGSSLIQASSGNFYGVTYQGGASSDGIVFELTPGGSETVLYSFKGGTTDGSHPSDNVIQASDGNFYGTTSAGGANGDGVVFKITPSGNESVLYAFKGGTTDGAAPYGGLIQATDGNLYGMTLQGGTSNAGVAFKITPSGTESVLYAFKGGTTDGGAPYVNLIQASDGNFYGMTSSDGASGDGVIFKITPSGSETVLYSFLGGATDGATPYGGLIQASDGSLYGVTYQGGASNYGTVFQFN